MINVIGFHHSIEGGGDAPEFPEVTEVVKKTNAEIFEMYRDALDGATMCGKVDEYFDWAEGEGWVVKSEYEGHFTEEVFNQLKMNDSTGAGWEVWPIHVCGDSYTGKLQLKIRLRDNEQIGDSSNLVEELEMGPDDLKRYLPQGYDTPDLFSK